MIAGTEIIFKPFFILKWINKIIGVVLVADRKFVLTN
jgi:hypothetical protein